MPPRPSNIVLRREIAPRGTTLTRWERLRHKELHWFMECFAEFLAVFFYCYFGVGSTVSWVLSNILQQPGLSSILQVGFAYAMGIVFALMVCAPTSGGHLSPAITIALVLFRGCPPLKGVRYIIAQILGGYVACLLVYVQYYDLIQTAEQTLREAGTLETVFFTPNGPAGMIAGYLLPGMNLGRAFLNEFVTSTMINLVVWSCLDPTNIFVPPVALPFMVAFVYAAAVWSFAPPGIAANTARDLGLRFAAMTIWGSEAGGGAYGAIAALGNIPACIFAVLIYEFFLVDSDRVVPVSRKEYIDVHLYHGRSVPPAAKEKEEVNSESSVKGNSYHTENQA